MKDMSIKQLEKIMQVYDQLQRNQVVTEDVNLVYEMLPNHATVSNPQAKIREIQRFVIAHCNEIINDLKVTVKKTKEIRNGHEVDLYEKYDVEDIKDIKQKKPGRKPKTK